MKKYSPTKLGILGSTRGTNLVSLINAIQQKKLSAQIEVVISNKSDALILQRAQENNIEAIFQDTKNISREMYDKKISDILHAKHIELIILIGYMRILSAEFVREWQHKIINVHPSLLPLHAGKMDLDVHRAVIHNEETETGCTVHHVTENVDEGPIIWQEKCIVKKDDTPEILKTRVQALEGIALVNAINKISNC